MQTVKVPQLAWFGPRDFEFLLPDDWQVEMCYMAGRDRRALKPEEIRQALNSPIDSPPLRELARGKKQVAIVFDDLTRAIRTAQIVPFILDDLAAAGIPEDNIRFICGLGMHGAMERTDFAKKLGEDVISRFRVYNHNPFSNCAYVGTTTTFKTRVCVNEEYLKCDLKIVIGGCVPHPMAGFGGGSKLILPGISSFETVNSHHKSSGLNPDPIDTAGRPTIGMGLVDQNRSKKDINEAAELAGIDFLVNGIINLWGETSAIYAGNWKAAFAEAVKDAKTHYRTPPVTDKDVVISNSYAKASEALISLPAAMPLLGPRGGDIVLIANAPEGQCVHYLVGAFGKTSFGPQYMPCKISPRINKVIYFTEYPHRGSSWFGENDKIFYLSRWKDVLDDLRQRHGKGTRVAVIPDATNQFFAWFD